VNERTAQADAAGGFILDGFPRTTAQAEALDGLLNRRGQALDAVVLLTADEAQLLKRLSARRECPTCKRAYNLVSQPPKRNAVCDDDGTALVQREDDREETIAQRLAVYRRQTAPLVDFYRARGRLREIRSEGDVRSVFDAVAAALPH
jgi:adenylate kinase